MGVSFRIVRRTANLDSLVVLALLSAILDVFISKREKDFTRVLC